MTATPTPHLSRYWPDARHVKPETGCSSTGIRETRPRGAVPDAEPGTRR